MLAAIPEARNTEESTKKLAYQPLPKHDDRTCLCGQALESVCGNIPQASDFHITRTDLTTCIIEIEDFLYLVRRAQSTFRHDSPLGNERCTNVLKEFGKSLSALDKYFPLASAVRHIHRGWNRASSDTGSVPAGGEDQGETEADSIRPEASVPAVESTASNATPTSLNDGKFFHTKPPEIARTKRHSENKGIGYIGRHSNSWLFNDFSITERVKATARARRDLG